MGVQIDDTAKGLSIGSKVSDKIGLYGVTPVIQPLGAAQAAAAAQSQTALTDSSGGSASTTLADAGSITSTGGNTYADADVNAKLVIIANAIASLAAELALIRTDVANVKTLQEATRNALVNVGIMKGAA